ncbi:MAG: PAS domain S-box protein [Spirochaetaceae bacterium]|nr:MAG: PAS domain S-box protein [Spirochaetaceae bacterium]
MNTEANRRAILSDTLKSRRAVIIGTPGKAAERLAEAVAARRISVRTAPEIAVATREHAGSPCMIFLLCKFRSDRLVAAVRSIRSATNGDVPSVVVYGSEGDDSADVICDSIDAGADEYLASRGSEAALCASAHAIVRHAETRVRNLVHDENHRSFLRNSFDMAYDCTADDVVTDINAGGVDLLGLESADQIVGHPITEYYAGPEDREHFRRLMAESGFVRDFEVVMLRRDGRKLFALETSVASYETDGAVIGYHARVKDITERVRSQKQLMQMNIELAEANRKLKLAQSSLVQREKLASVGQLAAGLAHEVNNPLGFVKSNLESVRDHFGRLTRYIDGLEAIARERADERVTALREAAAVAYLLEDTDAVFAESTIGVDRIAAIVDGLKTFARYGVEESLVEYDINSAVDATLAICRNEFRNGIEVQRDLARVPPVPCRPGQINQVVLNLVLNATYALRTSSTKRIEIKTRLSDGYVACEVSDTGCGMLDDVRNKVFDPFFTTKPAGEGTGLGLSISYDIVVNKHEGRMSVTSKPGDGSTFSFCLPLRGPR